MIFILTKEKKEKKRKLKFLLQLKKKNFLLKKDAKYKSILFNRFINRIMLNGKKSKTSKLIFFSLKKLKREFRYNPIKLINQYIIKNLPVMSIQNTKLAGKPHIIPYIIKEKANKIKFTLK